MSGAVLGALLLWGVTSYSPRWRASSGLSGAEGGDRVKVGAQKHSPSFLTVGAACPGAQMVPDISVVLEQSIMGALVAC